MFKFKNQAGFSKLITTLILLAIIVIVFISGIFIYQEIITPQVVGKSLVPQRDNSSQGVINNFEDCVASGQPILESYPRQCISKDGGRFIENIKEPIVDTLMIRVDEPEALEFIVSPLLIKGQVRGTWFFEGDFPIILTDENGNELALAIASTDGEWMTEDFVDFEAELIFEKPEVGIGILVFKKDNPSGLSENDASISIPILFK